MIVREHCQAARFGIHEALAAPDWENDRTAPRAARCSDRRGRPGLRFAGGLTLQPRRISNYPNLCHTGAQTCRAIAADVR